MRILLINHLPLVGSGSGVYTSNLAKSLKKRGHEVCIIFPENETKNVIEEDIVKHPIYFKNEEEIPGQLDFNFPCFTSHPRSNFNYYDMSEEQYNKFYNAFDNAIREEIIKFKPDIIHAQHIWIISSIACKYNIPTIVSSHGTDIIGLQRGDRYNKQAEYVVNKAKKIIAVSSKNCELIKKYFPKAEPEIIPAGYDTKIFNLKEYDKKEILSKYGIDYTGQKIILYAGRLTYLKGVDILLEAAKIYEKENVITIIAGNGDLKENLKNKARDLQVKNVFFIGHNQQSTLSKLYNIADVFAMPSRMEALGLVAIEALACGTPVVCTDEVGVKDYIIPKLGKIVKSESVSELANALIYIINNSQEYVKEQLSKHMIENFTQENEIKKIIDIYIKIQQKENICI